MADDRSSAREENVSAMPVTGAPTSHDELSDEALRAEIELLAEVIAEVGRRQRPLENPEIDRILGVTRED
jgi:hypothetical protein